MLRLGSWLVAIVGVSVAGSASAEEAPRARAGHVLPEPDPTAMPVISAGAGLDGFIGNALRGAVGPGPSWNVRASMGTPSDMRIELVYMGTSQAMHEETGMPGAQLVGHGVQALLRANVAPEYVLEPFFFAGAGWTRFHVSGGTAGGVGGAFRSPDHVLEIPFGFGVARRFGRLVLDVRTSFSLISGADLVPQSEEDGDSGGENMHRAGLRLNLGFAL